METVAAVLIGLVALEHVYFVLLEMVLWKKRAHKVFPITREFAEQTASMASNQGLYNGFLVAALLLGLFLPSPELSLAFKLYGLICVVVAGLWGGITVHKRIFFAQAVPAGLALAALALA